MDNRKETHGHKQSTLGYGVKRIKLTNQREHITQHSDSHITAGKDLQEPHLSESGADPQEGAYDMRPD
eukprot:13827663-Heterocapsa_arctica.AAC.1